MRQTKFVSGEYYHIYNRGVDKRKIFLGRFDYERFLLTIKISMFADIGMMMKYRNLIRNDATRAKLLVFYQELSSGSKLADVVAYCLNPNHYHFILMQRADDGISKFMHKLNTSYTNYFNKKNERSGSLFQGPFKSIHIDSNEYLLYLSAYVNGNNFIHGCGKDARTSNVHYGHSMSTPWPYCSYLDYIGKRNGTLCDKNIILDQFDGDQQAYKKFCGMNMNYLNKKKEFAKYLME